MYANLFESGENPQLRCEMVGYIGLRFPSTAANQPPSVAPAYPMCRESGENAIPPGEKPKNGSPISSPSMLACHVPPVEQPNATRVPSGLMAGVDLLMLSQPRYPAPFIALPGTTTPSLTTSQARLRAAA